MVSFHAVPLPINHPLANISSQPLENEGNSTNWTLRFKHGRLTVLLFTEPLTPFSTLKDELLSVLRERYPKGLPKPGEPNDYVSIPDSIDDVALAFPADQNDMSKGWKELELSGGKGGMKDSPKGKGLKDGGVLAFRFRSEAEDEDGEGEGDGEEFVVEWPSYDDNYGDQVQEQVDDMMEEDE